MIDKRLALNIWLIEIDHSDDYKFEWIALEIKKEKSFRVKLWQSTGDVDQDKMKLIKIEIIRKRLVKKINQASSAIGSNIRLLPVWLST